MIDVWGADHGGYVKRMQAAVKAVSDGKAELDVKIVQLVKLLRAGEPVKMSKRSGDFVTLREVVEEVGRDAVRFDMLYRKNDAVLDFDLAKVIEAVARQRGVLCPVRPRAGPFGVPQCAECFPSCRATTWRGPRCLADAPLERLVEDDEFALIGARALSAGGESGRAGPRAAPGRVLSF